MANGHGGARANSGNKTKQDFEKTNNVLLSAIKIIKDVTSDEEARIELAKDLYTFERGKIFIAEHIFGKPEQKVEQDINIKGVSLKDIISFGSTEPEI